VLHRAVMCERVRCAVWFAECWSLVIACLFGAWTAAAGCATTPRPQDVAQASRAAPASFSVYALSRGRGVPDATRSAWQTLWELLETARRDGAATTLLQTRIGLEGEVRLCAEFSDARRAQEMLARAREMATRVELLNVVEEPCSRS
jgi:hypothetical protein